MLAAGVSRAVINPPLTVPHAGWGAQTHLYPTGIEYDLWATALYITDETTSCLIVDLDLSHLSIEQADAIRARLELELGLSRSFIRLSTTHSHATPMIHFNYYREQTQVIDSYIAYLEDCIVAIAREAQERAVPVRIAAGYGHCEAGSNRRQRLDDGRVVTGYNPDGHTDPVLGAIRLEDEEGQAILHMVHYACHPTTLGPENQLVSPDYPGITKRTLEQLMGGHCMFLQGSAGDIGPGPEGFQCDYAAVSRIGRLIAYEAAKVLLTLEGQRRQFRFERVVESGASLAIWKDTKRPAAASGLRIFAKHILLPIKSFIPVEEAQRIFTGYQNKLYQLLEQSASAEEIKEATYKVKRSFKSMEQAQLFAGKTELPVEVQFVIAGDIALVSAPIEPFSRTGKAVREQSPFPFTYLSGYSNGWVGYLPTREEYAIGGYEVETSIFLEGSAERFTEEVTAVLKEAYPEGEQ